MLQNDKTIIENSFVLAPDDTQYCQSTFDRYTDHLQFITSLADDSYSRIQEHVKKYESTKPYDSEFAETYCTVTTLRIAAEKLTKTFASQIQRYFRRKYNIDFDSLNLKNGRDVIILQSYGPLISNIVNQVGNDFHAVGREQVKKRFQDDFRTKKSQPILKNNVIQFPSLASYYEHNNPESYITLKSNNFLFERCFLDSINFFFFCSLQQPQAFTELLEKWAYKIDTDIWYTIVEEHNVSLKFFKNRRVNLKFKNASEARHFYEYFSLEGVAARNIQCDISKKQ